MRNLGKFVGAIWHGIKSEPNKREVQRVVEEEEREHEGRKVIVRRTTIDEVEVKDDSNGRPDPS